MTNFTRDTFHNSQILLSDRVTRYANWCSHAVYGCAISLCLSTFIPSHVSQKLVNVVSAIALFGVSNRLDRLAMYASGYGSISEQRTHAAYSDWLSSSLAPPKREIAIAQPEIVTPVKYAPIESSLKKPHLMILGETGSGKSTICKYLVSQVNAPCLIIDPHASPTDWRGFVVTGSGRNYSDIATEFERLANLMQIRYEARDNGVTQFDPLIVIIDEFPAIASSLGKNATDTVKLLAREARKVSIRMCLLSQGAEVKTLGLEGEGSIRECFAMLRLGNFALSHGKSLKDKTIGEAMEQSDHPAMLDQLPCNLPVLSDNQTLPVLPLPSDYLALLTNPIADTRQPSFATVDNPSTLVSTSAQSKLSAPLQAILEYAKKQDEFVSARKVQSSIRIFRDTTAPEIRSYFQWLADQGYGIVKGEADSLEFSAN